MTAYDEAHLRCLQDLLVAAQGLMAKHDPALVLKVARDWVDHMHLTELIQNRDAWSPDEECH